MCENTCNSCKYFQQHYTFNRRKLFRVHCGHCTFLKAKRKLPNARICENYHHSEPDVSAFVSKEYLNKELLRYLLSLELLPEIEDITDKAK